MRLRVRFDRESLVWSVSSSVSVSHRLICLWRYGGATRSSSTEMWPSSSETSALCMTRMAPVRDGDSVGDSNSSICVAVRLLCIDGRVEDGIPEGLRYCDQTCCFSRQKLVYPFWFVVLEVDVYLDRGGELMAESTLLVSASIAPVSFSRTGPSWSTLFSIPSILSSTAFVSEYVAGF